MVNEHKNECNALRQSLHAEKSEKENLHNKIHAAHEDQKQVRGSRVNAQRSTPNAQRPTDLEQLRVGDVFEPIDEHVGMLVAPGQGTVLEP